MKSLLLSLLCGFSLVTTSFAAAPELKETDKTLPPLGGKWSFEPAKNPVPALPRVLLIGDSICIGYKAMVIAALADKANVDVWPHPLFQSEKLNLALAKILKNGPYDVVHVNLGLHGVAEGRIKPGTYEPLTRQFIQIIRDAMPQVKIIWANTTQFTLKGQPTVLDPVKHPTVLEHNRMAAKLMAELNIPVNDFFGLLINKLELGRGDTVHWTPPAYQILADQAVASIFVALGHPTVASAQTPPRIVCFGDSITKRGYPTELASLLGVTAANAGIAGHTSRQGLARMQRDVIDLKPEVVVIFFGTNDCRLAHETVYVPPERYAANLTTMVETCERLGIKTVLCTLPPIDTEAYFKRTPRENFDAAGGLANVVESYRAAALRVAEAKRVPVVDLNRLLVAHPEWMHADGVHPTTPEGNRLIAQFVAAAVAQLIKK